MADASLRESRRMSVEGNSPKEGMKSGPSAMGLDGRMS